jgi:hypothetical protein
MTIDRKHLPWAFVTALGTAGAFTLYLANFHPSLLPVEITLPPFFGEVPPSRGSVGSSPLGIIYGALAFAIFVFASMLGARKKKPLWKIGHPRLWLRAHIWLTIFSVPLVLFHCGFKSGGPMTTLLLIIYSIVMVSGFFGLALQQFMPSLMRQTLPQEVVFEQIPYIRNLLLESARKFRESLGTKEPKLELQTPPATPGQPPANPNQILIDFFDHEVLPYLACKSGSNLRLGKQQASDDYFRLLKLSVATEYCTPLDEAQNWCDERRNMDLQTVMHHWLHGWLLIHVPVSLLLLLLTSWHLISALRFL